MKTSLLLSFILLLNWPAAAITLPDTIPAKKMSYVELINGKPAKGYIVGVNDSTIQFVRKEHWKGYSYTQAETIPAEQISYITKNFKNGVTVGQGLLFGGLTGILLGFTLGLTRNCDDPNQECDFDNRLLSTRSFTASFIFGGSFGIIGMFIGLFSKKKDKVRYDIHGNRENLKRSRVGLNF